MAAATGNNPKFIIVHHSAISGTRNQAERINEYHKSRGFPRSSLGFYGGYHRLIDKDAQKRRYREDEEVGAHTVSYNPFFWGMNKKSIGICVAGDFTKEKPSFNQLQVLRSLIDFYQARFGIPDERVLLHRQVKATACPGTDLTYLAETLFFPDYEKQLETAEAALKNATGSRKRRLTRLITRLKRRIEEVL